MQKIIEFHEVLEQLAKKELVKRGTQVESIRPIDQLVADRTSLIALKSTCSFPGQGIAGVTLRVPGTG